MIGKVPEISYELNSSLGQATLDARVEFEAQATTDGLQAGVVNLVRFNVLIFSPPLGILRAGGTGTDPVIGISLTEAGQPLSYDPIAKTLEGTLDIQAHHSDIDRQFPHATIDQDYLEPKWQSGTLAIKLQLDTALEDQPGPQQYLYNGSLIQLDLDCDELAPITTYSGHMTLTGPAQVIAGRQYDWEPKNWLPIQPVIFSTNNGIPTGDALASQQASCNPIWNRGGYGFYWRQTVVLAPIKYNEDPQFQQTTTCNRQMIQSIGQTNQQDSFFPEVDLDAVEVYFCHGFSQHLLGSAGGGVTHAGGSSEAKVVLTDELYGSNQDLVLAHELGHVLRLKHPTYQGCMNGVCGTGGSLMCTAKYGVYEHPSKQSDENGNLANNPLLVGSLVPAGPYDPDCLASGGGCGGCPCDPDASTVDSDQRCGAPTFVCEVGACTPGCGEPGGLQCLPSETCQASTGRCE